MSGKHLWLKAVGKFWLRGWFCEEAVEVGADEVLGGLLVGEHEETVVADGAEELLGPRRG